MNKRGLVGLVLLLALAFSMSALAQEERAPAVESIRFAERKVTVLEGEAVQAPLVVKPEGASMESAYYKAVSPEYITVDETGLITGIKAGSSNVVAFVRNEKGESLHCTLTVVVQKPVTSVEMYSQDVIVNIGRSKRLDASVVPSNASSRVLLWTSSDERIVSVDNYGTITGLKAGEATITATSKLCPEHSASTTVKVIQDVSRIKVTAEKTRIGVGETTQLYVKAWPEAANPVDCTFETNNDEIATVDENGVVTGHKRGKITVYAYTAEGIRRRDTLMITVTQQPSEIVVPETAVAQMGKRLDLACELLPANANDKALTFASSDETVARIDEDGRIVPVAVGACEIIVSSKNWPEVSGICKLTVVQPITKIKITDRNPTLLVGQAYTMTTRITPADATIQALTYSTNKEDVVSVDETGTITGVGRGRATVYAKAQDGSRRQDTLIVTVVQQPEAIAFSAEDVAFVGYKKSLDYEVLPENTNDKSVVFSSSDERIAKVSQKGVVTPLKKGTAVITVSSKEYPEVSASCTLDVQQYVEEIVMSAQAAEVMVTEFVQLGCQAYPQDASNKEVIWSSSDEKIATVDEKGLVHGLYGGRCTILATAADGSGVVGKTKLTVIQPVTGVSVYYHQGRVGVGETKEVTAVLEPRNATNRHIKWTVDNKRLASVKGENTTCSLTGKRWGTVTVKAETEDGGFTDEVEIKIGNYDYAVVADGVSIDGNHVPTIMINNVSDMSIAKVYVLAQGFDLKDGLVLLGNDGNARLTGAYSGAISPTSRVKNGIAFANLSSWNQKLEKVQVCVTGYETSDGMKHEINRNRWMWSEAVTVDYQIYQQTGGASHPTFNPPNTDGNANTGL